jgi:hypothetical protein
VIDLSRKMLFVALGLLVLLSLVMVFRNVSAGDPNGGLGDIIKAVLV